MFYDFSPKIEKNIFVTILNSTIFRLLAELDAQELTGNLTILTHSVETVRNLKIPDPAKIPEKIKKKIEVAFEKIKTREVFSIFDEIKMSDRRELDAAVFVALGFSKKEIPAKLDELYFRNLRAREKSARKIKNDTRRKSQKKESRGDVRKRFRRKNFANFQIRFSAKKFPADFVDESKIAGQLFAIPKFEKVEFRGGMFSEIIFDEKKVLQFEILELAEFVFALAKWGNSGKIFVAQNRADARKILDELEKYTLENGEPKINSGRQEMFESMLNDYLY